MDPAELQSALDDAILAVMDIDLYNQELATEERDSAQVIAVRQQVEAFLKTLKM